jgi:hypothetical protein
MGKIALKKMSSTPWHEAGHAVVARALGREVQRIETGEAGGSAEILCPVSPSIEVLGASIAILFGGYLAERRFDLSDRARAIRGASHDFRSINDLDPFGPGREEWGVDLRAVMGDVQSWRSFVRAMAGTARTIIVDNWLTLGMLAAVVGAAEEMNFCGEPLRHMLSRVKSHEIQLPPGLASTRSGGGP